MKNKGTSEKKGISLIVLVITIIVIIILAVAVILSIANNNPIENAKEARFKNDVKTMQEELELLKASNYAKNNGASYNDPETGEIKIGDLKSATNYQEKFAVKDGELKYIEGKLTDEEKTWVSNLGVEKAPITFTGDLVLGGEVEASNGEQFYVIGGEKVGTEISNSTQDVLLLAKYNLKLENGEITLKQDTSGGVNPCAFSSTNYWSSATSYLLDLNNYTIPDGVTSIITKAKEYGNDLGVVGRLMTASEVETLGGSVVDESTSGCPAYINTQNYWLGSARSEEDVCSVSGERSSLDSFSFVRDTYYGVRPVIKVSKSLVQ